MKRLLLVAVIMALSIGVLRAQDITGTWQGTLQAGAATLRTVIKVSNDAGTLKAVFYSIDQGAQGIGANSVTVEGTTVRMAIATMGVTYEGKLGADGNSIAGTFTQGGRPLPLNLTKATPATAWAIPEAPAPIRPMAATANPVFEVATVKPSRPETQGKGITVRGRQVITLNTSLADLVAFAYGLHAKQIVDAPAWVETDKFDIVGQPDIDGMPNDKQIKAMVQKLMAERFKLAFHRDKKELSVYALGVTRTGSKLAATSSDPNSLPGLGGPLGSMQVRNATMADFAGVMQASVLDRPVIDQTGLTGRYDFTLRWTPDDSQYGGAGARMPPPADAASAPPGLFTAIQEQLGLRLEATKAQADVIVIDKVEKPSPD